MVTQFTVDGVLHAVGTPNGTTIEYTLTEGLKYDSKVIKNGFSFKDVAFEAYKEAYGEVNDGEIVVDKEDAASVNWVSGQKLVVYPYAEDKTEEEPATADMLGKAREIEAEFALFGNVNNKVTYNFEVLVKSAVYSETPAEYVTNPAAKLTLTFTDNITEDKVDPTSVDLATITEAVLAYGPQAGGEYSLWNLAAVESKPGQTREHKILNSPKKLSDFVIDANNEFVEIDVNDLILFGYSETEVAAIKLQGDDADPIYIKYDNATVCAAYIEANATATDINLYKIFSKYYDKMAYDVKT